MPNDTELIEKLFWSCPEKEQKRAIDKILNRETFDVSLLIRPGDKGYWDNCALILSMMDPKKLLPVMDGLFEWLQDMNWPGALTVLYLLEKIPRPQFMVSFDKAISIAYKTNDKCWLGAMAYYTLPKSLNIQPSELRDPSLYKYLLAYKDDYWD